MGAAQDPADQPCGQRGHTAAGAQQQKGKNADRAWLFLLIAGGVEQRTDLGGLGVADGL